MSDNTENAAEETPADADIVTVDLDEEAAADTEMAPESDDREDKRKERGMDHDAMTGMTEQNARLAAENALLKQNAAAAAPRAPSASAQGIDAARREIAAIQTKYNTREDWSQAETDTMQNELREAEGRLMDHEFDKRAAQRGYAPAPSQAQTAQAALEAQHPEIYGNKHALRYAEGLYAKELHGGAKDGRELHDKVITQAKVDLGLTTRPKPSDATKRRTSGESKGGNAGSKAPAAKTFEMGKKQRELARALYPKDTDKVAFRKWAKQVGVKGR